MRQSIYRFARQQMGTVVTVRLLAAEEAAASAAAESAFATIETLERTFSDYQSDSEVRRLTVDDSNAYQAAVPISAPLFEVLAAAKKIHAQTDGAFDVTVGPLTRLWRRAGRSGDAPTEQRICQALRSVGDRHLHLAANPGHAPTVYLGRPGMHIDLGGIAKGYLADRALETLRQAGYLVAMVDAGGDLALGQPPPGRIGWRIGIAPLGQQPPEADTEDDTEANSLVHYLELSDCGVATSGDAARSVVINGIRRSHVINPRTGQPLAHPWAATVIAPSCMVADAYASAAMVAGPALIEQVDETLRIVMARRHDRGVEWKGLKNLSRP